MVLSDESCVVSYSADEVRAPLLRLGAIQG